MGILSIFRPEKTAAVIKKKKRDADYMQMNGLHLTGPEAAKILASIDIDAAIAAHENWKLRLSMFVSGMSQEDLRPEIVCRDDQCLLGQWLHGSGKAMLGSDQSFSVLIARHKQFHIEASNVVAYSQAALPAKATEVLEGAYARSSYQVIWLLKNLKRNLRWM